MRSDARVPWPAGDGEMAELIRSHDWGATPLGPIAGWPTGLRIAVRLMLSTQHPVFIYWGPALTQLYNDAYRGTMGPEKHPAALGGPGRDTWAEIWDTIGPQIAQVMRGGPATWHEDQLVPVTRHGSREDVWWTYSFSPIDDEGAPNGVGGVMVICRDVTPEYRARTAARESEEQLRRTTELVPALLWTADPAGHIVMNQRWQEQTGRREAEVDGFGWFDAVHPEDRAAARAAFERAFATGEPIERQQRIRTPEGYRWHLVRHVPVRDGAGAVARWYGAAIDVHELREMQERQQVLVAELQHRTRNLITVVQSLSERTLEGAASLDDFSERFRGRLAALSRVQGLLSNLSAGTRVCFDELLRSELTALGAPDGRTELDGPEGVALRSSTVQIFALAIHELATNAVKHGALSPAGGRLRVAWRVEAAAGPVLHLDWRESGVAMPPAAASGRGKGYGRELIEEALPYQLKAETCYRLGPDGACCTISVPIPPSATEGDGPA